MMDSKVSTLSSTEESKQQEDDLQSEISKNQKTEENNDLCNTPASDIEAPLSPVLTNSKKSLRHIARRKSRIKLMSKFSQSSAASQDFTSLQTQSQTEEIEQISTISLTDNLLASVEISAASTEEQTVPEEEEKEKIELEERMKRCIEMQRKKKFCYNIAASSSLSSSTSESYQTFNRNIKTIESPLTENKNCDSSKSIESFKSNANIPDCKIENDFNFKIPESPVSVSKLKRARTEIMTTNLETNMNVGFETGSGKKIKLSEKALKRASKLFDDIIDIPSDSSNILSSNNLENNVVNLPETSSNNSQKMSSVGFKTASGNTLKLSETSMNKIKTLFDDIYDLSNYNDIEVENDVFKTLVDNEIKMPKHSKQDDSKTNEQNKTDANTKKPSKTQFKIPTQPIINNSSNKVNEDISPDNKNVLCTQITDTQMCWAAENAECMAEFMNSQWTTSPKDKTQNPTQLSNENNINKTQEDYDQFSSPESEQLFGNLTVCEDGTVANRNNKQLDKNDTNIDIPSFQFSTTPRKEITQVEDPLTKVTNMFQDCDNTNSKTFGFITATKKNITIPEVSQGKRKNIFQDFDIIEDSLDKNIETTKSGTSIGFATASGKKVAISEDSLKKAKNIFQDCDIIEEHLDKNIETLKSETSIGFATASGKKIAISEDSLKKAKNVFQDCDIIEEHLDKNIETAKSETSIGFATASGKKIAISEDSLKKAKNIFQDCDIIEGHLDKNIETPKSETSIEFATASGKKVSISEDSLKKAKNIFQDCDIIEGHLDKNIETPKSEISIGFATASGKKVSISEDSLKKAKNIFHDCDIIEKNQNKNNETPKNTLIGFATASGKKVSISEESLNKVKNIFQDCDIDDENPDINTDISNASSFGFTTSTDKNVILEASLNQDKNIYQNCDICEENLNTNVETLSNVNVLLATPPENDDAKPEETEKIATTKIVDTVKIKDEVNKEISQQQEQKNVGYVSVSSTPEKSVKVIQDLFNKSQNAFQDIVDLSARHPEEEILFEFTTPSTSIAVPNESVNKTTSENIGTLRQSLIEHKNISTPNIGIKEDSICSDCCGFTWEESLKSLKIFELYKRSFKYIEKDIKTNVFYPLSFTFEDIQSSKEYKNKNYRYSHRSRKKSSVTYGSSKRKSTRIQRKSINSSPITPELLNTSSMVTRSKRNIIKDVTNSSESSKTAKTRSSTRKSMGNASNDSSNSSISIANNSDQNIINSKSNSQKTIEDLEDAFLTCIENTLKYKTSQKTSTATDSFMSADDIDSLKEVFSEETNFDTSVLSENEKSIEKNSSDFLTPLEQSINVSEKSLHNTRTVDVFENTKIITNCPESSSSSKNVMNSGIYTATEKDLIVKYKILEKMKDIFNECSQEENKITNNKIPKNSIHTEQNICSKENKNSELMLKKTNNMFDDTEKENINTSKSDFLTKNVDENPKKARNCLEGCDSININLNTPLSVRNIGTEQKELLQRTENIIQDFSIDSVNNVETPKNLSSVGFSTASGKKVSISEESIKKVKKIFQDCDISEDVDKNVDTPKNMLSFGFSTASRKKVAISEESIKKAKNMFEDCDVTEEDLDKNIDTPKNATSFGFATASGKKVAISEESLAKAKNIFQDCDVTEEDLDKNIDTPKNKTSFGFATASGKKVAISEESLAKAKNIFQDCDVTEEDLDKNIDTPKNATSFGFATASGKKVAISEESLAKAKNIFQDCNVTEEDLDKNIDIPKNSTSGFATASGKKVTISEESLAKAKNIFQDCNVTEEDLDKNIDTPKNATSFGFATASGKNVTISEESLAKAKNIFQDCDVTEEDLNKNIDTPTNATSFGFATASGKKVTISEESLAKAKNIFQDCDVTEEDLDKNIDTPKNATSFGFATASGKKVTISEDSLKKAKNIFQDCDVTEEDLDKNIDTPKNATSFGFATASGKKVSISEESLAKAKNIFQDCDVTEEDLDKSIDIPKNATSFGFATASGKKVTLSEDSLKKAKNIFQDCDVTEDDLNQNSDNSKNLSLGVSTASETYNEHSLPACKHIFDDSFSTPTTSIKGGFSTASGSKVIISEDSLNKVRNILNDNSESPEIIHKEDCSVSISVPKKSLKKSTDISENCEEYTRKISTPNNDDISKQNMSSIQISKSKAIQKTDSSPAVTANKSYSSPQISTNDSTPILRNKTSSARNSTKRSLGVTSCRQIDIPENTMKRAKLIFDDIDSPKKKETIINNNHLQNNSPLINKTNIVSKSTPNISAHKKSLLNSTITMKETNQQKVTQNLVTPKISPLKKLCLGNENMLDNSSFAFQKRTSGDSKKWSIDLQKELEMLKLKMSVIETRLQVLKTQQEIIETGSSDHRRQRPGWLFTQKSNPGNRISLKTAVKNRRPEKNTHQICLNMGVDPSLLEITAENSSTLHFHVPWWSNDNHTYPAVIRTEDGAVVVPNQQNFVGVTEIERAFLAMPGVDPSLVPKKWVTNHFRWIVWKLASLERNFPDRFKNCLTVESVVSQLKYRYDREIDRAQRPALKKIVECDDTAAKRMVLCVATIIKLADNRHELELTDGWYSIITSLDVPLNSLVERNVIKVGMKLMTQGAELQNCEGCCPLELPSTVRLQINYNSTRRAAWHLKLGYQPNPGPLRISLRMIAGNGGPVAGVRAYVARVYPISFMERCEAAITWRNQRAELRRTIQWEAAYSNSMETMQMVVQQELEREWEEREKKGKGKRLKIKNVEGVVCGETLYQFVEDSNDPDSVKELLTSAQISILQEYQSQLNTERQAELTSRLRQKLSSENIKPRNVSTVLKLLLVDVQSSYHHRLLSIWRPTETHTQLLKEGLVINIYNVAAKNNGTLSSIPRTQFDVDSDFDTTKFENINRFIIPISQTANPQLKPQFGEFDTLGMIVTIDVQQTVQTLWIADESYRFLLIKIREGPETCCLFDGLTPGKIVAVLNLIHQKSFKSYGEALANQYTVLSSYPQQEYLQDFMKEFIENLSEYEDVEQYLEECKKRIEEFSTQNLKHAFVLNPLNVNTFEEEYETLTKKLCGIETTQQNKSDSLTLSDEEMALIDTQTM